ncbi:MAG: phosphatidylserine decarboxylase [Thermovirgaceae bacterium]|nr:phosphatidylserine decarboxylase [Thermovirgaceae bacterium]
MRLAPEGRFSVGFFAGLSLLSMVFLPPWTALVFAVFAAFLAWFFRDPERGTPEDRSAWASPADGRVVEIYPSDHPFAGKCTVVGIFMSPLDVHVNRMPFEGTISYLEYVPGKKLMAFNPKASLENERFYMGFETKAGRGMTVQIAGFLARRIVCSRAAGETLSRGERFGMIKLGSKVDLYLPEGMVPAVVVGQKVRAGETAIGVKSAR